MLKKSFKKKCCFKFRFSWWKFIYIDFSLSHSTHAKKKLKIYKCSLKKKKKTIKNYDRGGYLKRNWTWKNNPLFVLIASVCVRVTQSCNFFSHRLKKKVLGWVRGGSLRNLSLLKNEFFFPTSDVSFYFCWLGSKQTYSLCVCVYIYIYIYIYIYMPANDFDFAI